MQKIAKEIPPPATYNPDYNLVESTKFKKIGFGVGMRMAPLLKLANSKKSEKGFLSVASERGTPGPGTYKIPSTFEKHLNIDKMKRSLIRKY